MGTDKINSGDWDLAVAHYSSEAVAYLLDLPIGQRPSPDDVARREMVRRLGRPIVGVNLADEHGMPLLGKLLTVIMPGQLLTCLENIRTHVGGRLSYETGDELVDSVVRLVFNDLALELMPEAEWDRFSISAAFQDPRLCSPAASAFLRDPELSTLFPGADPRPDEHGRVNAASLMTWLPAGGGTIDIGIMIGNLVEQTLSRMRFKDALAEERIVEFVRESLEQIRRLARGEEVDILVLTGLLGIETSGSLDRGSWGLRSATGLAISDIQSRDSMRPKSVLWTEVPHRIVSCHRSDISEEDAINVFAELSEHGKARAMDDARKTLSMRLGLLAWAIDGNDRFAINVQATSSWSLLPIAAAQPPWVHAPSGPIHPATLSASDLAAIAEYVEELEEATPRLDVALTRIVRVASEHRDPHDSLVDAVIAWENLFGSRSETTFRVCAALAWILEPDNEESRRKLFKKANDIYELRSRIVHGSADADIESANDYSKDALYIAVQAFRRIHADPTLAGMRSTSRSKEVLLRAH